MTELMLVIATLILFGFYMFVNRNKPKLPPGPIRWPIIGSIPQMLKINPKYPHLQINGLAEKYGSLMSFGFGVHYAVVVSDFDQMKAIMRRYEANDKFVFDFLRQRNNYKNLGIIWGQGETALNVRKKVMKLLRKYGFGKKYSMDEAIQAEVKALVADLLKEIMSNGGIWKVDENRIAACQINIIWASVGGYRFDANSSRIKRLLKLQTEILDCGGPKNMLGAFPFLKMFPEISGYKRICDLQIEIRNFVQELVEDAKQKRESLHEAQSFIEAYLDEIKQNESSTNEIMTEEQLIVIMMDLFLAGADTTNGALCWIIFYLGVYPDVQNKARAEIQNFKTSNPGPIPSSELKRMPYVNAIIMESMRHAPFLPIAFPRLVVQDFEFKGYIIPKGTCLFQNFYAVFHDKIFWGDPEVFRPERFLLPSGKLDPTKTDRIVQFGNGGRFCPGEDMAMISLFMMTVGLLDSFAFEVVTSPEVSFEPEEPAVTMKPKKFSLTVDILT